MMFDDCHTIKTNNLQSDPQQAFAFVEILLPTKYTIILILGNMYIFVIAIFYNRLVAILFNNLLTL